MEAVTPNRPEPDFVRGVCARHGDDPAALLEILHDVQAGYGCVPETTLPLIAEALNLSRADVHGVMSFYHDFRKAPAGRVVVKVCRAESCQSMGAERLIEEICRRRETPFGSRSADRAVTIEAVYCLGNCALSPAAMVNGRLLGRADADRLEAAIEAEVGGTGA